MKKLRSGLYPLRDNAASWSLYQLLYWWRNIVRKKSVKASAQSSMHGELKWSSIRSSDWIWWTVMLQSKLLEFISHYMIRYASCELQKVLIHLVAVSCGRVTNKKRSCGRQLAWPPHWQDTSTLLRSANKYLTRPKCYYLLSFPKCYQANNKVSPKLWNPKFGSMFKIEDSNPNISATA